MKLRLLPILIITLAVVVWPLQPVFGSPSADTADNVLIYMIDKLNIDDIDPELTPNLWLLKEKGGMGLLNPVTSGARTGKNVCSTISAGELAIASDKAQLNFEAREIIDAEKAGDIFYRHTGIHVNENNLVVSTMEVIKKNNQRLNTGEPGILGDKIQELGYQTVVIGNSDLPGYYSRLGPLVLMNKKGIIDSGAIGKTTLRTDDKKGPKYQSNYSAIIDTAFAFTDVPSVILIEFGDLGRLESAYSLFSPPRYKSERKQILTQIDNCIGELQHKIATNRTCVYIITPSPARTAISNNELLLPLVVVKPGIKGTLTSYTTHRDGIVSAINIKNSILNCLDPEINDEITSTKDPQLPGTLGELNKKAGFNHANQAPIMSVWFFLALALLLLASLQHIFRKRNNCSTQILMFVANIPLTLLIMSKMNVHTTSLFIAESVFINLLVVIISWVIARIIKINPLIPIFLLGTLAILADLTVNYGLIENSIMSYQLLSGIRYYGLGNEYMGVLLATAICFSALLLQGSPSLPNQVLVAFIFSIAIFMTAYPSLGSNVGGAITANLGLWYTFLRLKGHTIDIKKILLLIIGTMVFISIIIFIDINQPLGSQSHLGKTITLIIGAGSSELFAIIIRKLQMHLGLINYHFGGWILLSAIFLFSYLLFNPKNKIRKLRVYLPKIYTGLQGLLLTAIIAIFFNDSGIVTATILFLYFVILLIYSIGEIKSQNSGL